MDKYSSCESHLYMCDCDDYGSHVNGNFHAINCSYAEWYYDQEWYENNEEEQYSDD